MVFLGLDRECRGRGGIQRRRRSLGRVGFHINRCVRRALPTPVGARLTAADTDHAHLSRPPARGSSGRARPAWRADGARVSIGATGEDTLFADTNEGATRIFELWDASDVPELANHSSGGYWVEITNRIEGAESGDRAGCAEAISGDGTRVAAGFCGDDSTDDDDADATSASGGNLGKVRVYALPAFSTWRTAWDAANN